MNFLGEEVVHTTNETSNSTHCSEHAAHEQTLFGATAVYSASKQEFFVMVVIVIGFVLVIDFFFHVLHFLTHESPFNKMINAVEKELMTVGFTAFVFKIIINSTGTADFLSEAWLHAFELAGKIICVGLILSFSYYRWQI